MAVTPNQEPQTEDVVAMIEKLMADGTGHLTITPDALAQGGLKVDTYRSMDCAKGNMACCQPTEFLEEN